MFITPDLINAVAKINPIFLEGTLKIASAEAKSIGLKDGQIIQAVIENRAEQTKLLIGNKEFELPKNSQFSGESKFQARVSITSNGTTFLTPTALSTGQSQTPTLQSGFTPISPHLMNLLLHTSGFANLSHILNSSTLLGNLSQLSGISELISKILGLRASLINISPNQIKSMIYNFGLSTESQLAKRKTLNSSNQKLLLFQLSRILSERGFDPISVNRAILDIESSQLDSQQNLQNRDLAFSIMLPFKEFGDVNLSFFRSTPNPPMKDPPYTFNLHTKNDLVGEVWLRAVVEKKININLSMWATQSDTYINAKENFTKLNDLLKDAGLNVVSFEIFNEKRPGKSDEKILNKKKSPISSGSVIDVEA